MCSFCHFKLDDSAKVNYLFYFVYHIYKTVKPISIFKQIHRYCRSRGIRIPVSFSASAGH